MVGKKPLYAFSTDARKKWFNLGLPFSLEEYESRIEKIQKKAISNDLEAVILHGDANENGSIRWVSNFEPLAGSTFIVIPSRDEPILISDSVLHGEPMHSLWWLTWISDLRPSRFGIANLLSELVRVLKEKRLVSKSKKVGLVADYGFPVSELKSLVPDSSFLDFSRVFSHIKLNKSDQEIRLMEHTTEIAAKAMHVGCDKVMDGVNERSIAAAIDGEMMELGAHDRAFYTMVVSGERTHLKHSPPLDRKMKKGEMVFIDAGSSVFGYYSDLCRTLTVGSPNEKQRQVLEGALEIHKKTVPLFRAGTDLGIIASKARSVARECGLTKALHVDGHGMGTSMFDPPSIYTGARGKLEISSTLAFEPMIFSNDFGTVSFEDDYLINSGNAERLTKACPQKFW